MAHANHDWSLNNIGPAAMTVLVSLLVLSIAAAPPAHAQTITVLHAFTGGSDGAQPQNGVTLDRGGNLYGTTVYGGVQTFSECQPGKPCGGGTCQQIEGCGVVYKLTHAGSGWIFAPLYQFLGASDGDGPVGKITIAPDGSLYGTTVQGGIGPCQYLGFSGCGSVYRLQPPAAGCRSSRCSWRETQIYLFTGGADGGAPTSTVTFDAAGNMYGTTPFGGGAPGCQGQGCGVVYKLTPSGGGNWQESALYAFSGGTDGGEPNEVLTLDHVGNLYGTTTWGGLPNGCDQQHGCGTVFELFRSGSGWGEKVLYTFQNGSDGSYPDAGVLFDAAGNLYGSTSEGGLGNGGTIFSLSPQNGNWNYGSVYSWYGAPLGPYGDLVMDAAGNLYGTTFNEGANGFGSVFKLTPSNGGWTYTDLHDFSYSGGEGFYPTGGLVLDGQGHIYGTSTGGGAYLCGVVWELTL